jgi:putative ABC transport system ATP-binding protein
MTATMPSPSPISAPSGGPSSVGDAATPVAELRRLRKTYYKPDGSVMVEALKGIDVCLRRGEYVAIIGASGSGKSTLMNIIGCLDRPTAGSYLLAGTTCRCSTPTSGRWSAASSIGFIFQGFNLLQRTSAMENVEMPLVYLGISSEERHERARRTLELVGLGDRLANTPSQLSGGQQQRVAIARALVTEPEVLLADEPTGNLDSSTGAAILELFERLHEQGMTIIMVTHDDSIAKRCRRVVRLKDGLVEYDRLTREAS